MLLAVLDVIFDVILRYFEYLFLIRPLMSSTVKRCLNGKNFDLSGEVT
jgi:hypothetical protein